MRTSGDLCGNEAGLVDDFIGSAYDVVKAVYDNLPMLRELSPEGEYIQDAVGAVGRSTRDKLRETLSPKDFGAVGDGVADDGPALNLLFNHVRTLLLADHGIAIRITGGNAKYRTTIGLNLTNISAWSLTVADLYIIGECTGKPVIDLSASRGYTFDNVFVWGSKLYRPSVGFQAQRGTPDGFCDNATFRECGTDGWFSKTAVHDYGQETTTWMHCSIYNRDHTASVAVHTGYSSHPMTSEYAPMMSGGTSFTNKQFLNMDWRYLPADENIASITMMAMTDPMVITTSGHSFAIGDEVVLDALGGVVALSAGIFTVTAVNGNQFTISADGTVYGGYTGGGYAIRRSELPPVYIGRAEGLSAKDCYIVSYGQPHIALGYPDPSFQRLEMIKFDNILFEGAGVSSCVYHTNTGSVTVQGFELTTYNAHCDLSIMETGFAVVGLYGAKISSVTPVFEIPLTASPAKFAMYDSDILFSTVANTAWTSFLGFTGKITGVGDGKNISVMDGPIIFNDQRFSIDLTFDIGSSTAALGANKPGSNQAAPSNWIKVVVDGIVCWVPAWQ